MSIATACKANGINVNDRRKVSMGGNEWRNISRITHICRHHSGVNVDQSMQILEGYWKNAHGWNTGGYHVVIHFNGDVDWNYDYGVISNGVGNHNSYTFHISVLGNGKFTPAQEKSFNVICKEAQRELNVPVSKVWGHREFKGHEYNSCPGINMDVVRKALGNNVPVSPKPNPQPIKKSNHEIAKDVIAGKFGNGSDRQKNIEKAGYNFNAVQTEVNKILNVKTTPKVPQVKVDGYLGSETIKSMQRYFGTPVDGKLSKPSLVIKKLQGKIGTKADGYLGYNSIVSLQRYLKTPVDGKLDQPSMVIKELQRRLNSNNL